jgi:hypothetical protein
MHQLPASVHFWSAAGMFVVEVAVPWLIFAPPRFVRLRAVAAAILIALQLGIAATGNYGFFNLLATVLYLALLDDRVLTWRAPAAGPRAGPLNGAAIWHSAVERGRAAHRLLQRDDALREIDLTRGAERGEPLVVEPGVGRGVADRLDQRLRAVPGDDDRAPGDRRRSERGRNVVEGMGVHVEGGGRDAPAVLRPAAHAAARLADVVCSAPWCSCRA